MIPRCLKSSVHIVNISWNYCFKILLIKPRCFLNRNVCVASVCLFDYGCCHKGSVWICFVCLLGGRYFSNFGTFTSNVHHISLSLLTLHKTVKSTDKKCIQFLNKFALVSLRSNYFDYNSFQRKQWKKLVKKFCKKEEKDFSCSLLFFVSLNK